MNSKRVYDGVELAATGESCPLRGGLTYTSQRYVMGQAGADVLRRIFGVILLAIAIKLFKTNVVL